MILLDLYVNSSYMVEAFLIKRAATTWPWYFFGVCPEAFGREWVMNQVSTSLASKVLDGTVSLPGIEKTKMEMPPMGDGDKLSPPELVVLTFDKATGRAKMTEASIKKWGMHNLYGSVFAEEMDKAKAELGYGLGEKGTELPMNEAKAEDPKPTSIKQTLDAIVPMESLPGSPLAISIAKVDAPRPEEGQIGFANASDSERNQWLVLFETASRRLR